MIVRRFDRLQLFVQLDVECFNELVIKLMPYLKNGVKSQLLSEQWKLFRQSSLKKVEVRSFINALWVNICRVIASSPYHLLSASLR